jgi:hypothetical protein
MILRVFSIFLFFSMPCVAATIQEAEQRIRQEMVYVKPLYIGCNNSYPLALATMNYIVGHVSAPNYGYLNEYAKNPTVSVQDILKREAGICGSAQECYMALAYQLGLQARRVYIWYPQYDRGSLRAGHCVVEVFWNGKWHFFDTTYGAFFRSSETRDDVLSLIEVLEMDELSRKSCEVSDHTLLWQDACHNIGLNYLNYSKLIVQIDNYSGPIVYERE